MYSILQLYDKGYKVRYTSDNLEEINEKYQQFKSIIMDSNKIIIFDEKNNELISSEQLKVLMRI
tara:strand:+ start:530 stop:721 length:192 start_codon:yes stop_codon:yes gene_type:complete